MTKEVAKKTSKLPAHLANLPGFAGEDADEWGSGQSAGFPVISTKGKVFHIRRGDETELVAQPDDPDEPATNIPVVILKTHPGTAKTYYEGKYVEGSDDKPTCYSNDGVHPAADAQNRQHKNCALCPRNQWGSRMTEDGKKAKQCSDVKRLAVVPAGQVNDPMLLRIPPTSLKTWDNYTALLKKRGLSPRHVITKIGFDHSVSHQALTFKPTGYITEEMVEPLTEALESDVIESIIGTEQVLPPVVDDDEELDTDTGEVTKKSATEEVAGEVEDDDEFDMGLDDDGDDEAQAAAEAAAKKKAAAKKAAATRARNKAKKEAEAKAAAEAAAAEEADDDDGFDFEDEDDEPAPAKKKTGEIIEGDFEEQEDDAPDDDLDFDDFDFD